MSNIGGLQPGGSVAGSVNMAAIGGMPPSAVVPSVGWSKDSANISSDLGDKFQTLKAPFADMPSGSGMPDGLGMVPGFGGATSPAGSMFGGAMEDMQKQQQDMMLSLLKMLEELQKKNGFGSDKENMPQAEPAFGGGAPSGGASPSDGGLPFGNLLQNLLGGAPSGGGGCPSGGSGSPSGGGGCPSGGGSAPSGGGGCPVSGGGSPASGAAGGSIPSGSAGKPAENGNQGNSGVNGEQGASNSDDSSGLSREELKKKIDENIAAQGEVQTQLEPAKAKQSTLDGEVKTLEGDNSKIKGEIEQSKTQQTRINGEVSQLDGKEKECQQKLEAEKNKKDENGKPAGNPEKFESELNKIKEDKAKKQEELKKEKETEQTKQKELNENTQKLTDKKSELENVKKEVEDSEKKLETLKAEQTKLQERLEKLENPGEGFLNKIKDPRTREILSNNPEYAKRLEEIMANSTSDSEDAKAFGDLLKKYGEDLKWDTANNRGTAFYSTGDNAIRVNANADQSGRSTTHELSHSLDHMMADGSGKTWASNSKETIQAINNDYNNNINSYMQRYGGTKREAEQAITSMMMGRSGQGAEQAKELFGTSGKPVDYVVMSDTYAGVSEGNVRGALVHKQSYYSDSNICLETFANMGSSALSNPQALANMKKMMPETYNYLMGMVRNQAYGN